MELKNFFLKQRTDWRQTTSAAPFRERTTTYLPVRRWSVSPKFRSQNQTGSQKLLPPYPPSSMFLSSSYNTRIITPDVLFSLFLSFSYVPYVLSFFRFYYFPSFFRFLHIFSSFFLFLSFNIRSQNNCSWYRVLRELKTTKNHLLLPPSHVKGYKN